MRGGVGKVPRWEPRSRLGVYLGHSPYHAGSIALILNLTTGHVSPQYHVVFDDDFTTIENLRLGTVPTNWTELNLHQREEATNQNFQLSKEWLQDDSSDNARAASKNIDWLAAELSKPHFIPWSFKNEGASSLDMEASEGALQIPAQVEACSVAGTIDNESIAVITNADESEKLDLTAR